MPWGGQHLQLDGAAACRTACTHRLPPGSMRLLSRRSMQCATNACSWLALMPSCAQMRASLPVGEGSTTSTSSLSFPLLPAGVAAPSGLDSTSCLSPCRPLRLRTVRSLSTCRHMVRLWHTCWWTLLGCPCNFVMLTRDALSACRYTHAKYAAGHAAEEYNHKPSLQTQRSSSASMQQHLQMAVASTSVRSIQQHHPP